MKVLASELVVTYSSIYLVVKVAMEKYGFPIFCTKDTKLSSSPACLPGTFGLQLHGSMFLYSQ